MSVGLFQVHDSNARRLGLQGSDLFGQLFDPVTNARAAMVLLAESVRLCGKYPLEDQLAEYAVGRAICDAPAGLRDSRAKTKLAARLLRQRPVRWLETTPRVNL
jgi:hypothetical protein